MDPTVVAVRAAPTDAGDPDAFRVDAAESTATIARGIAGHEYIVLSDGWRRLRLDIVEGSASRGEWVRLDYRLSGFRALEPKLQTLRQLALLRRDGRLLPRLFPRPSGLSRRVEAIRVADALADGASYRDIAVVLFGEARVRTDWRTRSDYLLSRLRRRAAEARHMLAGGYRSLFSE